MNEWSAWLRSQHELTPELSQETRKFTGKNSNNCKTTSWIPKKEQSKQIRRIPE